MSLIFHYLYFSKNCKTCLQYFFLMSGDIMKSLSPYWTVQSEYIILHQKWKFQLESSMIEIVEYNQYSNDLGERGL